MKMIIDIIAGLPMNPNRYYYTIIAMIGVMFFTTSCRPKELTAKQYFSYWSKYKDEVSDKEFINETESRLTYNSTELLVLNDLEGLFSKDRYEKVKQNFCQHYYFTLDILNTPLIKKTGDDLKQYFVRDRQKQFTLITGTDSIPCALYHPEIITDGEKQVRLNLVFPRPSSEPCGTELGQDLIVSFKKETDSSNEITRFVIKREKINQLPKIKF